MKNLAKKSLVPAFASALLILAAGQAQAITVDFYSFPAVIGNATILEDFENIDTGWYEELTTGVGIFTAAGLPGTGRTASGNSYPDFEVRDHDDNGRVNTTLLGSNYLDSADITQLSLNLNPGYDNIFFTMSDPSDVSAITTVGGNSAWNAGLNDMDTNQDNGNVWLAMIDGEGEDLASITWRTNTTNDGYGLDDFGTRSVPEPATALLLGAGLLPLMGFLRRKKEDEM